MQATKEQQAVVNFDSGNLVVTASAGSGKTRVMTERFCRLVVEGKANVDQILCVTFTKLAAGELKKRLTAGLRKSLPETITAENKAYVSRMNEQISLVPTSFICTVDSFCNFLVKKYFYVVKVDPQYSIIEPSKADAMKQNAIDEVFERLYEADDEDIILLLSSFSRYRNDNRLKELIIQIDEFLSSEVDKKAYLDKNEFLYSEQGTNFVVNELIGGFIDKCKSLYPKIDKFISDCLNANIPKYAEYYINLKADLQTLENNRTIDQLLLIAEKKRSKPNVTQKNNFMAQELSARFDEIRKRINSVLEPLVEIFKTDIYGNSKVAEKLFKSLRKVTQIFEEEYKNAKEEISVLDYADLEYYAYQILCNNEVIAELYDDFKYIFVDEYQDTNAIQDAIFSKLQNDNLFIVGDMKQSIYGFRGCDCALFDKRIEDTKENGTLIKLDKNFRSTSAVIECVNNIFSTVMTKDTINLDYASNKMEYGGLYPNNSGKSVIVQHIKAEKATEQLPIGIYGIEKHLKILNSERYIKEEVTIRKIIESVLKQTYVDENGNTKTYSFSDIAVISRTSKGALDRVASELIEAGIPVVANSKRSVGDYPEIRMLISILQCIDFDGMEDFSLATTLKSPVANLTDEELLNIRKAFPKGTFFKAVSAYRDSMADGLAFRLNEFFEYLDKLRLLSGYKNVSEVLKKVIFDSDFEIYLLKSDLGDVKQKRANRFVNELESFSELTVSEFLKNKDSILKNMTVSFAEGDNAVKLLDIHQSKGLEFPIVIQCEMDRNFFVVDNKKEVVLSRKNGIGLNSYDYVGRKKANTIQRFYISQMLNKNTLQDEMRLFYVATTRAEHRLYMVTTADIAEEVSENDVPFAKKYSDFLAKNQCEFITSEELEGKIIEKQDVRPAIFGENPTQDQIAKIDKYLNFDYPYQRDTKLSLKTTVTQATRRVLDDFDNSYTMPILQDGLGDVDTGNAYHRFLELSSFDKSIVDEELEKFVEDGKLSQSEYDLLEASKLKEILSCKIFAKLKGYKLYHEQPFMCLVPAEVLDEEGDSQVLIQGVIDLLAVNGDNAIIVDYKYSGLSNDKLLHKYKKQLELYGFAVEKVLKKKLENLYLFNINTISLIKVV